ncbi:efflux RND transporter periplasmic adaptor subunit [Maribrevibacterium harenarium]|uniref:Efflux RND transporter periplasmic adaptor subunit n=1 Tax=Maribrevibacterium harenarium TaxID=2589817 RepID=A0A501X4Z2_9GAMM|nr:efflux RND transporter periplasmic adaptor subunit [Maribrevibacterium harenarium]TPE55585.1 efflux RND transporter periplasmic adaptor subunit [Maribrevibacterium harenarium]
MGLKNRVGPISAVALTSAAVFWMVAGGNGITTAQGNTTPPPKAPVAENPEQRLLAKVQAKTITAEYVANTLPLSGHTQATDTLTLTPAVGGKVTEVLVKKGQLVEKGAAVLKMDTRALEANIVEARSLVKQRVLELDGVRQLVSRNLSSQVNVAQADAALASARATLKSLEVQLENATLIAPFTGIVNELSVNEGQVLSAGAQIGTLLALNPITVSASIPQTHVGKVHEGTRVNVRFENGNDAVGHVSYVSANANSNTRTLDVELTVPNDDYAIPAAVTAQLDFVLDETLAHAFSPALLSIDAEGDTAVKTLDFENRVVQNKVKVIKSERDHVWVTGLPQNVNLITVGQGFVTAGDVVEAHYQN